MPTCQGCGSTVSDQYARVFTPDGVDQPRVCPFCEEQVRDGAEVREARSTRHNNGSERTRYDPEKAAGSGE